jgi:phospholipase C
MQALADALALKDSPGSRLASTWRLFFQCGKPHDGSAPGVAGGIVRGRISPQARTFSSSKWKPQSLGRESVAAIVKNVFVLMLENRSFDHMLGFSGIEGTDAETGQPTTINGLKGNETNSYQGQPYPVAPSADDIMPMDPGHEFPDVVKQLCGENAAYPLGGPYPPIDNSGFVADYAASLSASQEEANAPNNFGKIMKCFSSEQLPVLNALAKAFVVCDNWHASIPGPTWPNRLFACGASSAGLDHSPTTGELATWETVDGFEFRNGSIFDALRRRSPDNGWRIYAGDHFPMAAGLKGIDILEIGSLNDFTREVKSSVYPWLYTWIEPNYGDTLLNTYRGGNSQHPLDDVTQGEALIKTVYEAIRNSTHWEASLLIVTWDEHGGFYDHVAPPKTTPPGDTPVGDKFNQYHFPFDRYGVRVPAIIVSPLIPANLIDHRLYDHSSIPKTLETEFGLPPLTERDKAANDVTALLSLTTARTDAPTTLPNPAAPSMPKLALTAAQPDTNVDGGNLPAFLHVAMRADVATSPPEAKHAILARVQSIQTRGQATQYIQEVQGKLRAMKTGS